MGKKAKARQRDRKRLAHAGPSGEQHDDAAGLDEHPAGTSDDAPDALSATSRSVTPARHVSATGLAASLYGLGTLMQRQLGHLDTGDGLTRARLSALAQLVLGGPRTLGELAAGEGVRPPTMTRLVQAMEADGIVVRERHPTDRRRVIIHSTPAGEALLEEGRAARIAPLTMAIDRLDRDDRAALDRATGLLDRVLREAAPSAGSGVAGKARGRDGD